LSASAERARSGLGRLMLLVLVLLLLVVVCFSRSADRVVRIEDAHDSCCHFVVNNSLVILANNVNAKLL